MSPEMKQIYNGYSVEIENYNPEKSDIFSLGLSYLRIIILLEELYLHGLNDKEGEA